MIKPILILGRLTLIMVLLIDGWTAAAAEPPAELVDLRKSHEKAVEKALSSVHQDYVKSLRELRLTYMKADKLEEALCVDEELRRFTVGIGNLREIIMSRNWHYSAGGSQIELVFRYDGRAEAKGQDFDWTWKILKGRILVINYEARGVLFDFGDLSTLRVSGRTEKGELRELRPLPSALLSYPQPE